MLTAAMLVLALFAVAYLVALAFDRRVLLDVRLLLILWIVITTLVYCSFPAAAAERAYPIERYVAWIEANSELRRPARPLPEIRLVSAGAVAAAVSGARFGAYRDGVVYVSRVLPLSQQRAVVFHEVVHWMQPWGCRGARELQAHTLTAAWADEQGIAIPPIPWPRVEAAARACQGLAT